MPLPNEISTTLLLSNPARIDVPQFRRALEGRLAPNCPEFVEKKLRLDPLLSASEMYLHLKSRDLPLTDGRLDEALDSGLAGLLGENPSVTVARHRVALTVIVGHGNAPSFTGQTKAPAPGQQAFDRMLIVAHAATSLLVHNVLPLALHWGQSNQILSTNRFSAMSEMLFPLPLFLHPRPRRRKVDGIEWLALELVGAEQLIGRPLATAPAPVDLAWMMQRVYAFVAHLRANGLRVNDGMSFSTADGERFTTRLEESGELRLVLDEKDGQHVERMELHGLSSAA